MTEHQHKWRTRYVTIKQVDCVSGMECDCGVILIQDVVEDAINALQQIADDPCLDPEGNAIRAINDCNILKMSETDNIVEQFSCFVKAGLPEPEILAWMKRLTPEERQQIEDWTFGLARAAEEAIVTFREVMLPLYRAVKELAHSFCERARALYVEAGAPYGEDDEGMWRWLREQVDERNDGDIR